MVLDKFTADTLSFHSMYLPFQWTYRHYPSTETVLLAIHYHITRSMHNEKVTAPHFLDLFDAFYIADHDMKYFTVLNAGLALMTTSSWFAAYLHPCTPSVHINMLTSTSAFMGCVLPKSPILCHLICTLNNTPLLGDRSLKYHL